MMGLIYWGLAAPGFSQVPPVPLPPIPVHPPAWGTGQQPSQPPLRIEDPSPQVGANFELPSRSPHSPERVKAFAEGLDSVDGKMQVVVGQGRLLTLRKELAQPGKASPLVAVGDPTILNFEVVGPRQIRLIGQRLGITDFSVMTSDDQHFNFQVHVIADLEFLSAKLESAFPEAELELGHLREHVFVKGQARDSRQVTQILATIQAYLNSLQVSRSASGSNNLPPASQLTLEDQVPPVPTVDPNLEPDLDPDREPLTDPRDRLPAQILPETGERSLTVTIPEPEIINLIRVPGPQQVLLKVQVAELNRSALRQLGVSFLLQNQSNAIGSTIAGPLPGGGIGGGTGGGMDSLLGLLNPLQAGGTVFGIFDNGDANFFINALRQNQVFKILAEPNLVAMNGQQANFLSGGEFPVLIPQPSGGGAGLVTVEFREFGVQLDFVPYILDEKTIRLAVAPEVSSLDFSSGVTIAGTTVPGLATRRTRTVVEIKEGQTLAISGILQITQDGTTSRIPFLGDLPYLGPLFSNNTTTSTERELIILVTPYLVESMHPDQVPPLPGEDVLPPTDLEFYLKNRIERRTCAPYRATAAWDDPLGIDHRREIELQEVFGPYGYSH